jgi:hypothetical protein
MTAVIYVDIDIIAIMVCRIWSPVAPVRRVITPVVGRIPSVVAWSPKPRENRWSVNIYRFDNVVWSVNVRITDNLNIIAIAVSSFYYNRSNILK